MAACKEQESKKNKDSVTSVFSIRELKKIVMSTEVRRAPTCTERLGVNDDEWRAWLGGGGAITLLAAAAV